MNDFLEDDKGRLYQVHAWVDTDGNDTTREKATGAIGKNEDGSWWSVSFPGHEPKEVAIH